MMTLCKHCKMEIWVRGNQWHDTSATTSSQYCWIDPSKGSQLHEPIVEPQAPEVCNSFALGDVVKFKPGVEVSSWCRPHEVHGFVVNSILFSDGYLRYGIAGTAWHDADGLELVRRATPETLAIAAENVNDEGDSDDDDYEEEDDEGEGERAGRQALIDSLKNEGEPK